MLMKSAKMIQDRRCFRSALTVWIIAVALGLYFVAISILGDRHDDVRLSFLGLVMFLLGSLLFLVTERASRPPWNNPGFFLRKGQQDRKAQSPPTLFCLGDSLTHGAMSANFVDEIVSRFCRASKIPRRTRAFFASSCPLWVINGGQNCICTWTTLLERVDWVLACRPDYVLIMIGSNDVRCLYKSLWSWHMNLIWSMSESASLEGLERRIRDILRRILDSCPSVEIGLCTLPPMGEDLTHPANVYVKRANAVISKLASVSRCTLIPVFESMEQVIRSERTARWTPPVDHFVEMISVMAIARFLFGLSWNAVSWPTGNVVLSDSIHLNERGRDVVVDLVVKWLTAKGIEARTKSQQSHHR